MVRFLLVIPVRRNIAPKEGSLQVHHSPGHAVAEILDNQEIIAGDNLPSLSLGNSDGGILAVTDINLEIINN